MRGLLCGPEGVGDPLAAADFSMRELFLVTEDAELKSTPELRTALWSGLDGLGPTDRRRRLLEFLTGVGRMPAPGAEPLRVEMPLTAFGLAEQRQALRRLPQAHTCTNTLELPNYWQALQAVEEEDGRPLDSAAVGFEAEPAGWGGGTQVRATLSWKKK